MTDAAATFAAHAAGYDAARRRLVPGFDTFYGTAVAAVALGGPLRRVLDLGAGTGLLAGLVRAAHPEAELTLLDGAAPMLERARAALGEDRTTYVVADLADPLPPGPWDAVVSALAVHHLSDAGKRDLFERVAAALRPGGVFVDGALARMREDRCASAEDQLAWLRDAGFDADCPFKQHRFAVLVGVRPSA